MNQPEIDQLRAEVFLTMLRAHVGDLTNLPAARATVMGEHAARIVKQGLDGMAQFDRTGEVRDPHARKGGG
jgi:hypothetical protein